MQLSPGNAEYLSCLSKQWSDLVFIPGTSDEDARTYGRTAIRLAEQARTCDAGLRNRTNVSYLSV